MRARIILGLALIGAGIFAVALSSGSTSAAMTISPVVAVRGVSVDATSDNGQRKLARSSDGTLYLAFSGPVDGVEQAQLYFSLDDGQSWKPERVLGRPEIWSDLPTIAAGEDGRLDAAWVDYESVGHVWHASRQEGTWSEPAKVSPGQHYAGFPAMVIVDGSAQMLWYAAPPDETREHGSAYEILHTSEVDLEWTTPVLLSSNSEDALNPALAASPNGHLQAAWFQAFQGSYGAQHAEFDGDTWQFPSLISPLGEMATGVSIEVGSDGMIHLVWEQSSDEDIGVAYARFESDTWSAQVSISESLSQDPVVAVDGKNRVHVLWSEDNQIMGRIWDGEWSSPSVLGPGSNPSSLSGEQVMATWTRETAAGPEVVAGYVQTGGNSGETDLLTTVLGVLAILAGVVLWIRQAVTARPRLGLGDSGDR